MKKLVLRPAHSERGYTTQDATYDWHSGVEFLSQDGEWLYSIEDTNQLIILDYTQVVILCGPKAAKIALPTKPRTGKGTIANNFSNNRHIYAVDDVIAAHDGRLVIGEQPRRK